MCLCVCECVQGSPPHPCPGIWDWDFGTEILSERLRTQRHTRVCAHTSLGVNTAPQLCAHAGMCPPHTPNAGVHTRVHTHPSPSSKASHPSPGHPSDSNPMAQTDTPSTCPPRASCQGNLHRNPLFFQFFFKKGNTTTPRKGGDNQGDPGDSLQGSPEVNKTGGVGGGSRSRCRGARAG